MIDTVQLAKTLAATPRVVGPRKDGHYIGIYVLDSRSVDSSGFTFFVDFFR
jgi:hypothetical protein